MIHMFTRCARVTVVAAGIGCLVGPRLTFSRLLFRERREGERVCRFAGSEARLIAYGRSILKKRGQAICCLAGTALTALGFFAGLHCPLGRAGSRGPDGSLRQAGRQVVDGLSRTVSACVIACHLIFFIFPSSISSVLPFPPACVLACLLASCSFFRAGEGARVRHDRDVQHVH